MLCRAEYLSHWDCTETAAPGAEPFHPQHAPGAVWDPGTEGKLYILRFLASMLLLSYLFATAPYIPVSVPQNRFLLMLQSFPRAFFVPKRKLTALGVPPL